MFLLLFNIPSAFAQSGFILKWDSEVGCLEYENDRKKPLEDIANAECLLVCEGSTVNFSLENNQNQSVVNVTWETDGGEILSYDNDGAMVKWPQSYSQGSLSASIELGDGSIISGSICVDVKPKPQAEFEVLFESNQFYCSHTDIYFENLSQGAEGTQIYSYYWDFGDGTTTSEKDPVHSYEQPGTYEVVLTVYDECHCSDTYIQKIEVRKPSFEISCPTVICEGDIERYSLDVNPFGGEVDINCGAYPWKVEGGDIIGYGQEWIDVVWNNVDESGFGYIYFDQTDCAVGCPNVLAVKIPVVAIDGKIGGGKTQLCKGEQSRYSLPQWPTTDFKWRLYDGSGTQYPDAVVLTDQRNEIVVDSEDLPFGTYFLRADYTNTLLNCGGRAEYMLNVQRPLEIDEFPEEICQFGTQTFALTQPLGNTQWIVTKSGNTVGTGTGSTFQLTFDDPGYYTVRASAFGYCEAVARLNVVEIPSMTEAEIQGPDEVCPQSAETFYFVGETSGFEVEWSVDHGEFLGGNLGENVSILFDDNYSSYEVNAVLTHPDLENCSSEAIAKTVVRFFPDAQIVNLENNSSENPQTFCTSSAVHFGLEGFESDSYFWRVEPPELGQVSDNTQNSDNPIILFNELFENELGQLIDQGTIYVEARVCGKMETITSLDFSLNTGPHLTIVDAPEEICGGEIFTVFFESDIPITIANPQEDITLTFSNGQTYHGSSGSPQSGISFQIPVNGLENVDDPSGINISYNLNVETEECNAGTANGNILINAAPIVEISRTGPNAYCLPDDADDINTVFQANTQGVVNPNGFVWHFNGTPIPDLTNGSLGNTPILDINELFTLTQNIVGAYYVIVTGSNGCETRSDSSHIIVGCTPPPPCSTEEITSLYGNWTSCNTIELTGFFTGTPDQIVWQKMSGLTVSHSTLISENDTSSSSERIYFVDAPGVYVFNLEVRYVDCWIFKTIEVEVGYQPKMNKIITCNGNEGYEVTLLNHSPFLLDFSDFLVTYHIMDLNNSANNIQFDVQNADQGTIYDLPEGNYEIGFTLQKGSYPACTITEVINLQLPDASFTIQSNEYCAEESVTLQPDNPDSDYIYTWEWQNKTFKNKGEPIHPDFDPTDPNGTDITLTVTGPYGCTASETANGIVVHKAEFGGKINPDNPTICEGGNVSLLYNSSIPSGYQWYLNGNQISGATGQLIMASEPGLYTLYLTDDNGCIDRSLSGVYVNLAPPPNVSVTVPSEICEEEEFSIIGKISPDNSEYRIYKTGTTPPAWDTGPQIDFADLPGSPGQYQYILEYRDAVMGCEDIQVFTVEVVPTPQINIQMAVADCDPYAIQLQASVSPAMSGIFTWSDGQQGSTILVNHGGPYRVRFQPDGNHCGNTETIDVPKNPKDFIWIFPDGCLDYCPLRPSLRNSYIIGPYNDFNYYAYQLNGNTDQDGIEIPEPYNIIEQEGALTLMLDNGYCSLVSEPLQMQIPWEECKTQCDIDFKIEEIIINSHEPFLVYEIYGALISNYTDPGTTVHLSAVQGTFVPSVLPLQNGVYITPPIQPIRFIPNSGFTGGPLNVTYNTETPEGIICSNVTFLTFPQAMQGNGISEFSLSPNPAYTTTQLQYKLEDKQVDNGEIRIYDLSGRLLIQRPLKTSQGTEYFDLGRFAPGTYIMGFYDKGILLDQKILVKK